MKNDRDAQTVLFDHYSPVVYGIISRYIRDDDTRKEILQETFIRIFTHIGQLKDTGTFEGWMRKIAIHHCINVLRHNKVIFTELEDDRTGNVPEEEEIEEPLAEVTMEDVYAAVEKLPQGYRIIFQLFAVDRLSHKEIAEKLGIAESTSKTQYMKAKQHIRKTILQKKTNAR